jgi:hypothetical protein
MNVTRKVILPAIMMMALLTLGGCAARETAGPPHNTIEPPRQAVPEEPIVADEPLAPPSLTPGLPSYIETLAQETIAKFIRPGMSEYEKTKAAFDYIIETSTLDDPIGLDLWRIRGKDGTPPTFEQNRSISVFLFEVGMCEDYAAALTLLLRGMDMEARYVPGLTYAADGSGLVNHAWTVAKIDGVWYHLDSQLEQNVTRRDTIRYRYFLKSDGSMLNSHRWGQNLIDTRLLTTEQNEEIARDFLFEDCPQDWPLPPPHSFIPAPAPDIEALKSEIRAELLEYERIHGPLSELELNIIPPVFALEGYPAGSG